MKSKIASKVISIILSLGLILQIGIPAASAEEINTTQETKTTTIFNTLSKGENNTTGTAINGTLNGITDGGDITKSGLDFHDGFPEVITQYKAGEGYVLFTPADESVTKGTIELNNATINPTALVAINLLTGCDVVLVIKGRNELLANIDDSFSGYIFGYDTKLFITGDGTLSLGKIDDSEYTSYGIYLEGESEFKCDDSATSGLNLIAYIESLDEIGGKIEQEVFGNVTLSCYNFYSNNSVEDNDIIPDLIIHDNSQLTLEIQDNEDNKFSGIEFKGNLSIGKNAKFIIGENVEFMIAGEEDHLPIVTNNGGSIIVKGRLVFDDISYQEKIKDMNIITEAMGKLEVAGYPIDAATGNFIFNDIEGQLLDKDNGGTYICGNGTMKWEPNVEEGDLIGGTITLNNADIKIKNFGFGNQSNGELPAIRIDDKNLEITLNIIGNNTIGNPKGPLIVTDKLNLIGNGTLTLKGNATIGFYNIFDKSIFIGKLNGIVSKFDYKENKDSHWSWYEHHGTAYGMISYGVPYAYYYDTFTVENGTELTIEPGSELDGGTFTNNGIIINNGTLIVDIGDRELELEEWVVDNLNTQKIKGNGIVVVYFEVEENHFDSSVFTNDGKPVKSIELKESLDFNNAEMDMGDLEEHGYHWDNENKKLTLQNLFMYDESSMNVRMSLPLGEVPAIRLPEGEDVTIELKGYNQIIGFKNAISQGDYAFDIEDSEDMIFPEPQGSLTVCGDGTLVAKEQTNSEGEGDNIITTTGEFILESGNIVLFSEVGAGLLSFGMEIKGGSIGREYMSTPIISIGDFKMSGGKVVVGSGEQGNLIVYGNLTLSGGELMASEGYVGILIYYGNVTVSGGKLTVNNAVDYAFLPTMGVAVGIVGNEDKKVSISGGVVDIKTGMAALLLMTQPGAKGKGIFETNGMTVTTNPKGGSLKRLTSSIRGGNEDEILVTMYTLAADEKIKINMGEGMQLFNACTSLNAVKTPSKPSNGGSSSGGAASNATVIVTPAKGSDTTTVTTLVSPNIKNGTANVIVEKSIVADAIKKAQEEAKKNANETNGIKVEVKVDSKNTQVQNISSNLPKESLEELIKGQVKELSISSEVGTINLDLETLKSIQKQVGADVEISIKKVDNNSLTDEAKKIVGNRPVFDFTITGTNGQKVTEFGEGKISISIPYVLGKNEKPENIVAYYIDNDGNIQEMPNSVYDEKTQTLSFVTNHFSKYAVGYKEDKVVLNFTDIVNHWAKEDIEFVTARGLFSGTSQDKFSPDMSMTRGMFVTVLGRLAEVDQNSYKDSSFADVKLDAYYMSYIEWARKNNIVSGISETNFAPEQAITREQMAVIMVNYARSTGFELPQLQTENSFADNEEISSYAKEAVKGMQMAGILSGKSNNNFDPKGTATRAEVSAVLRRFVELVEK